MKSGVLYLMQNLSRVMIVNEIKEKKYFTLENMARLNGCDYNKNDVRSYKIPPLSNNPFGDAEIHLAMPPEAANGGAVVVRTNQGNFLGGMFEDTPKKAARAVFSYPTMSEIKTGKGVAKVDKRKVMTLYPLWILERYGIKGLSSDLEVYDEADFYIDKKTKQFMYFLDVDFLEKISVNELANGVSKKDFSIYSSKEGKEFFAFVVNDFDDFFIQDSDYSKAFERVSQNYFELMLDAKKLESVIVVNFKNDDNMVKKETPSFDSRFFLSTSLDWSFFKAARYNSRIYKIDSDGKILTTEKIVVSRDHASKCKLLGSGLGNTNHDMSLIIPYTEKDWDLLITLNERLNLIKDTIGDLFSKSKRDDENTDSSVIAGLSDMSSEIKLLGVDIKDQK